MLARSYWHEENGVSFWPSSYEVRDKQGNTNGWIAQLHVMQPDTLEVVPFWPRGSMRFHSRAAADRAALRGGENWLRQGRPPITRVF